MKINFNYTSSIIFKRNLPLLLGLAALCLISLLLIYWNYQNYTENSAKVSALESELEVLTRKKNLIDFKNQVTDSAFDLDTANQVLTQLIPTSEDYFSILVAIERLSAKTNFIITSYNINVDASNPNKLAILMEGKGDPASFLEFLKEYNFSGGRLLTIDKIDFSQEIFSDTKINVNVYSGSAAKTPTSLTENVDIPFIEQILSKVEINLKQSEEVDSNYPTKSNPF